MLLDELEDVVEESVDDVVVVVVVRLDKRLEILLVDTRNPFFPLLYSIISNIKTIDFLEIGYNPTYKNVILKRTSQIITLIGVSNLS